MQTQQRSNWAITTQSVLNYIHKAAMDSSLGNVKGTHIYYNNCILSPTTCWNQNFQTDKLTNLKVKWHCSCTISLYTSTTLLSLSIFLLVFGDKVVSWWRIRWWWNFLMARWPNTLSIDFSNSKIIWRNPVSKSWRVKW